MHGGMSKALAHALAKYKQEARHATGTDILAE